MRMEAETLRGPVVPVSRVNAREVARLVYAKHQAVTDQALDEFVERIEDAGQSTVLAAVRLLGRMMLEDQRRTLNKPHFTRVQALSDDLAVEPPPAGYHQPNAPGPTTVRERVPSLDRVMTGDDQGRGYRGIRPISALKAFLPVKIKINGKTVTPGTIKREQMPTYIEQLERQGRGCLEHASMMRDLYAATKPGETGAQAVRRLIAEDAA